MDIKIDNKLWPNYQTEKEAYFQKVSNGFMEHDVKQLRKDGINDDNIFIAYLIGVYQAYQKVSKNKETTSIIGGQTQAAKKYLKKEFERGKEKGEGHQEIIKKKLTGGE